MPSVLCVGTVGLDTVETPFGRVEGSLGGSASYFTVAAATLGTRTQLVSVVGEDFPQEYHQLLAGQQADLAGLQVLPGECFRWAGRYHFDMNLRDTLDTQLNVLAEFRPHLPESFRDAPFVFLANIDPVLQLDVLEQMRAPRLTMLDSMNYWISGSREALTRALSRVDVVLMNEEEVRQYTGTHNLLKGAREIMALGPGNLIIKKGEYGAVLLQGDSFFYCPAYPLEDVKDPTGAGDSFAGGFLGYLAQQGELTMAHLRRALVYGSVVASFAVEDFSVKRLTTVTREEIQRRYREFREFTFFDEA
ncbi:MAG TPA: PfkB family carbohydrate kinase [Chloroflexota bacterium]|jgi:sugar/nucleoside kinase (ribokinase family)|nr:PfkB family carbohydrate kinase [Chloroflexota bacterium]